MNMKIDILVDGKAILGEGVLWDERQQAVWWVDIMAGQLHRHWLATGENHVFDMGQHIGTVGLCESGVLVVALADGFAYFDPETNAFVSIADPEAHLLNNRFNDGKPTPDGAFLAGTMAYDVAKGAGSLYRLDAQGLVETIANDVTISNGLAWNSAETTLYYIDTIPHHVYAFDYDKASGEISNQRIAFTVPQSAGAPDGMTIDSDDMLWIAHYGGGAVRRWNPLTGKLLESIELPATNITCCTFGGDKLNELFVTSARQGLSTEQLASEPHAGALFRIETNFRGRTAYRFRGQNIDEHMTN